MKRMVLRWSPGMALALFLFLAGCGRVFREPQVTIRDVQLAGLGFTGGTLVFQVEVMNPNSFTLNASQLEYELSIADARTAGDTTWVDIAQGVFTDDIAVGGGATEVFQVPIEFTYQGLGGAAGSLLRSGSFTYRATGNVDVRTPLGSRQVPFRRGGMVSLIGG